MTFVRILGAAMVAALLGAATPAFAQVNMNEPDPAAWLRQVYDLYQHTKPDDAKGGASDELVVKRASKALAALFKKDARCSARSKGVCALDWDFIIDGQDYELSDVEVGPAVIEGDKARVIVKFANMKTPCVNTYDFVREGGVWKVDDIETKSGTDAPIRIAKMIRDYKY